MPSSFLLVRAVFEEEKFTVIEEDPNDPGVYSAIGPPWPRRTAEAGLKNARQGRLSIRTHEAYSKAYEARRAANREQEQMILDFTEGDKDHV